jgi:hypothetical protein
MRNGVKRAILILYTIEDLNPHALGVLFISFNVTVTDK